MSHVEEGKVLWEPTAADVAGANLTRFLRWLRARRDLPLVDYHALWRWSVTDLAGFWQSIWDYFEVQASVPAREPLADARMPGALWFPGAQLNWAENLCARLADDRPVLICADEENPLRAVGRADLLAEVNSLSQALRRRGIGPGDRVVAYLPNIPEAVIAILAVTSLGAIWSSCPPEFGTRSVLDRFSQIEPRLLIAVDGYDYGGRAFDRRGAVAEIQQALPGLEHTILIPHPRASATPLDRTELWADVLAEGDPAAPLQFTQVAFDHPLWILYSSGTTGLPKPIVHGHGGILLEHLKALTFHNDLRPEDRFFWYSSTGWMMWNYLLGSLLTGCTAVVYNGSPAYPDINALWRLAQDAGVTYFGTSAAFISACIQAGIQPGRDYDLSRIRALGSTGSPLSVDGFKWVYEKVSPQLALESLSGGTDLCTAFVGGVRLLPIHAGEIQGPCLGARVEAFDEAGRAVVGAVGELVITAPMPSMPLFFWNDPDMTRYQSSYFEMYAGVWRHGDWIRFNERGGCVIYGRSDATINRHGVRMGTSEIYSVVESLPEVEDSLVIDLEMLGRASYMPLFVVLRPGAMLDDALRQRLRDRLRHEVSPRHLPDDIFAIDEVPYTLSGKKMEVPVRKILLGQAPEGAANLGAMRNPRALSYFVELASKLQK